LTVFLARIYVTLKPSVNDPQGLTVLGGLHSMGYEAVTDVRIGKYLEVRVAGDDAAQAETDVAAMCDQLLANPVIEEFRFSLEPVDN
jgi:phosphoribosylformylglycinamidine synthase PurS subunit